MDAALESLAVNTIRMLAMDAVEKAKSGHPGTPMGMADVAFVLWTEFLAFDPADPHWPGRDRFVLSAGHASMLLYSLLHLTGYDLPMDELKHFRQWESRTPGHPEYGHTHGVELTTGPLGQGFGNGVGMAVGGRMLAARFNRPEFPLFDYRVFGMVSDGDLMEGVSSESASLAGHWGLGNLVYVYDDNHITIEGKTNLAFSEDVGARFLAYGWHVQHIDGHDRGAARAALREAVEERERPSLIVARTHIAYGAPHAQDTCEAHGAPLGPEEVRLTKEHFGWPLEPTFLVPDAVREVFRRPGEAGAKVRREWYERLGEWRRRNPDLSELLDVHLERRVPEDLDARVLQGLDDRKEAATRQHSQAVLQKLAEEVPELVGGSADLEPSTLTWIKGSPAVGLGEPGTPRYVGRNFHFGIREHAMAAIVNGLSLTEAFIPFGSSFLVFTDYARPSIRLSALSRYHVIWAFTHDSVFLGEDGPTHQPIEHLSSLRAMPNVYVWRPADAIETAMSWAWAVMHKGGPSLIALTRQKLPPLVRAEDFAPRDVWRGAYVAHREAGGSAPGVVIVATGSEVWLAVAAAERLGPSVDARVVSMPCVDLFLEQDREFRDTLLPHGMRRVSLEAAATWGWCEVIGEGGLCIGLDRFGASAPLAQVQQGFGFTPEIVAEKIAAFLGR